MLALASVLAVGAMAAGCEDGGGDSPKAIWTGRAEFVMRANALCRKNRVSTKRKIAAFERHRAGRKPQPDVDAVHFIFLPAVEDEVRWMEELRQELDAPPFASKQIEELTYTQRSAINVVAVMPLVPSITAAERRFAAAGKSYRAYGLAACAYGT